jgi:hypothetical protein
MLVMARQIWTGWWEGESYHVFVIRGRSIEGEPFVVRIHCRWKEKSDEEIKKRQGKGLTEKSEPL